MIDSTSKKLRLFNIDNPMNLVKRRLSILKNKMDSTDTGNTDTHMTVINPGEKICEMNKPIGESSVFPLTNEIGIQELDLLYYDIFDEETNSWSKRSKEMEAQYQKDVLSFYQIFSGKKNKPANIVSFKDIELLEFHNLKRCRNKEFFEDLFVSKNDVLYRKYLSKIEAIQESTRAQKKQLVFILKTIFIESASSNELDTPSFEISPELTLKNLEQKQGQIKECILKIYMICEKNFIEALILYERMYDNRHGSVIESRIENVNKNWNSTNHLDTVDLENMNNDSKTDVKTGSKNNNVTATILNNNLLEMKIPIKPNSLTPILKNNNKFNQEYTSSGEPKLTVTDQQPVAPLQPELNTTPSQLESNATPLQSESIMTPLQLESNTTPLQSEPTNPLQEISRQSNNESSLQVSIDKPDEQFVKGTNAGDDSGTILETHINGNIISQSKIGEIIVTNTNANAIADANVDANAIADANADANVDANVDANAIADANVDANVGANAIADANANPNTNPNTNPNANQNDNAIPNANANANQNDNANVNANANANANAIPNVNHNDNANANANANPNVDQNDIPNANDNDSDNDNDNLNGDINTSVKSEANVQDSTGTSTSVVDTLRSLFR